MAPIKFYPSQIGSKLVTPLSFTDSPIKLLFQDIWIALINLKYAPGILLPLTPTPSGDLDELYPSFGNLFVIGLHIVLFFLQISFLISIPLWVLMPVWVVVVGCSLFWMVNSAISRVLNGPKGTCDSDQKYARKKSEHAHEQWIFLNGVVVGRHWLESAVNRIALTFGRPVLGIHNKTKGIIFDVLESVIQRSFNYANTDVRTAYSILKNTLYDPKISRIIFILHSQGAIEGSMIVDWLLAEIPQDLLQKLEIYTFGNAANHFNNPHLLLQSQKSALAHPDERATATIPTTKSLNVPGKSEKVQLNRCGNGKTIPWIEHYAHTYDYVSRWGVLYFFPNPPPKASATRFMGRLFERKVSGHQFVQHYLDGMFPLSEALRRRLNGTGLQGGGEGLENGWDCERVDEDARFMKAVVEPGVVSSTPGDKLGREGWDVSYVHGGLGAGLNGLADGGGDEAERRKAWHRIHGYRAMELSRLWMYRNGKSPD